MLEPIDVQRIYLPSTDFKAASVRRPAAVKRWLAAAAGCLCSWRFLRWVLLFVGWSMVVAAMIGFSMIAHGVYL
jgi:hypothetical protein